MHSGFLIMGVWKRQHLGPLMNPSPPLQDGTSFAPSPPVPNNKPRTVFFILERAFILSILMFCASSCSLGETFRFSCRKSPVVFFSLSLSDLSPLALH